MLKRLVVLCAILALVPTVALAKTAKKKSTARKASSGAMVSWWGPRLGFSSSPDQFVVGGQMDFREFSPGLGLSPNVEFGFGDDLMWTAVNADLKHHFVVQNASWRPYVGGGLSVNHWNWSSPISGVPDESGTEMGANLIFGARFPTHSGSRFFTEARIGIGDIPDLKIMGGWNFRM
jgi:hypothetical protein